MPGVVLYSFTTKTIHQDVSIEPGHELL